MARRKPGGGGRGGGGGGGGVRVETFEEFASRQGAGRWDASDASLHRGSANLSEAAKKRAIARNQAAWSENINRREQLQQEFDTLVKQGKIRVPSRTEQLQRTARGNPENASVQAARRLLTKQGLTW